MAVGDVGSKLIEGKEVGVLVGLRVTNDTSTLFCERALNSYCAFSMVPQQPEQHISSLFSAIKF